METADRPSSRRGHKCLWLYALALGAAAIVAQTVLVRELSLLWFGSELSWGLTLSAWLIGVSVGAAAGGRASRLLPAEALSAGLVLALVLTFPAVLLFLRAARGALAGGPGELVPLPQMAASTLASAGAVGLWVGALFPCSCALARTTQPRRAVGLFFAAEAVGALLGGAAFTFWWVDSIDPFSLWAWLSLAMVFTLAAVCLPRLRYSPWPRKTVIRSETLLPVSSRVAGTVLALAGLTLAYLAFRYDWAGRLERMSLQQRWCDLSAGEHVTGAESPFARLDLGRLQEQWTLYVNCRPAATFPNRTETAPYAHLAAAQPRKLRRVLLLGEATGELADELAGYPGVELEVVQLDRKVNEILRVAGVPPKHGMGILPMRPTGVPPVESGGSGDPPPGAATGAGQTPATQAPIFADGRQYLRNSPRRYDLVVLAPSDTTSIADSRFYTREFFALVHERLAEGGVLAFALPGPAEKILPPLRDYLGSIYRAAGEVFAETIWTWGDPVYVLAAGEKGVLTADPAELAARYAARGGPADFDADFFLSWRDDRLQPARLARLKAALDSTPPRLVNTDSRPVAIYLALVRHEQVLLDRGGPGSKRPSVLAVLAAAREEWIIAATVALGALVCAAAYRRRRALWWHRFSTCAVQLRGHRLKTCAATPRPKNVSTLTILFSLATTGLAGMALEIVLLAAFQNLYGYVYSHLALLIGVYMTGVAAGGWWLSRGGRTDRPESVAGLWKSLLALDGLLSVFCALVPLALDNAGGAGAAVEGVILVMLFMAGLAGGLAVPLAAGLYAQARPVGTRRPSTDPSADRPTGPVAGAVDAADCLGGALGALAAGLILLPLFGLALACLLPAMLKLFSFLALLLSRPEP